MKKLTLLMLFITGGWALRAQAFIADSTHPIIVHTVLFQFREQASADQIEGLMKNIGQLNKTIPGILQITHGKNFSERSKGYSYGVVMIFINAGALKAFYTHPDHQQLIQQYIKPILADMIVMDYETEAGNYKQQKL